MSEIEKNKRIARNTLVLYVRMLFLMVIGLYTSRVILLALGVEDFGIYNVVGGFVALFSVLSKSMSGAASRFLNFEMGRGNSERLSKVFSTTLTIHVFLAFIIAVLAEFVGFWFLNNKMVISHDRLYAANWVFQFSVLTFCMNLITVPFHAAIIAHERMKVFAYIGIFEGIAKLLICYVLLLSPLDRLIFYAIQMFLIQVIVCLINLVYCRIHFQECKYHIVSEKGVFKEISSFAGWNMIGSSSAILRNQGGNVLINLFGGPVVNAARAVANQVLHAVHSFVDNFFMALRPQITQSYACGNREYMMTLVFQGSRLSYYMLLILCIPIMLNTDFILHLWLKKVPDSSVIFVQLTLIFTMIESISSPLITAQLATGKIRNYQLVVGGLQMMNLPISYVILRMGGVPETILYVAIFISVCCLFARLYMLKSLINIDVWGFMSKVVLNALSVSMTAMVLPFLLVRYMHESFTSFVVTTIVSLLCSFFSILYIGCNSKERHFVYSKISQARIKIHL